MGENAVDLGFRFIRGWLVFEAHGLLKHSALGAALHPAGSGVAVWGEGLREKVEG